MFEAGALELEQPIAPQLARHARVVDAARGEEDALAVDEKALAVEVDRVRRGGRGREDAVIGAQAGRGGEGGED
ncbi:MAG: hypothetical protein WDO13_21340 [Verrucomicrobiota bacterium]